jgi:lipoic acid synthetase
LDQEEPQKVAQTVVDLGLNYVVLTCVDRDDLPDGGAGQFAAVIRAIRSASPNCLVEVLTSDYRGDRQSIAAVVAEHPEVFAHNVETVSRLTPAVRDPRAGYEQSLQVLATVKELHPPQLTKSSLMVGLGETESELKDTFQDLRRAGVDILTLGQYLQPTRKQLPVVSYIPPETFQKWEDLAMSLGFMYVAAGPLVRSSYRAGELFVASRVQSDPTKSPEGLPV